MSASAVTNDILETQLGALGIQRGDVVLTRVALKPMQGTAEKPAHALIKALLSRVGPDGGILGLAFTSNHLWPRARDTNLFSPETPASTGGFANAMLGWPGATRSKHPTNSFVAIGRRAIDLLAGHDAQSTCFAPIEGLLEANGKMLLVGCVHDSPGFSTVHWAQELLGLTTKNIVRGLFGAAYEESGRRLVYRKHDTPGCSMGFSKFYGAYVDAGALSVGAIASAYSIAIDARRAFAIELEILKKDPRFALCDRLDCFSCRGTLLYNKRDWLKFYARHFPAVLEKQWAKVTGRTAAK